MKELTVLDSPCCTPGAPPLEAAAAERLARGFKALADPTRIAIVNRLAGAGEVCVCELVDDFDLSQPTISHHLKILRDSGFVESRRRGTWAHYRLVPGAVEGLARSLVA